MFFSFYCHILQPWKLEMHTNQGDTDSFEMNKKGDMVRSFDEIGIGLGKSVNPAFAHFCQDRFPVSLSAYV